MAEPADDAAAAAEVESHDADSVDNTEKAEEDRQEEEVFQPEEETD